VSSNTGRPKHVVKADPKLRNTPQKWADRLVARLDADQRADIASNPKGAAVRQFGLELRPVTTLGERRGDGGWCDGMSFTDEGIVLYAPTPYSRRENFTVAHEVGHLLIDRYEGDDLWDCLADHPNQAGFIEETCDAIASRLLLPRWQVSAIVGELRPSGAALTELFQRSEASREACAIAVAERIGCDGFVLLAKADTMTLTFASRFGDTRPRPWRDDPIPDGHPLRHLQPDTTQKGESWWPGRVNGRRHFYHHAYRDSNGWIYAVFAENDLWEAVRFHLPPGDARRVRTFDIRCPCGYRGTTTEFPCSVCHQARCPKCGCDCDRKAKLPSDVCDGCFLRFRSHLLINRKCERCRSDD
jgi:IrrE N-terminal-like domain